MRLGGDSRGDGKRDQYGRSDTDRRRLTGGALTALGLKSGGLLLSYLVYLLIARRLGAEALGVYALALTVLNIASLPAFGRIDQAVIRELAPLAYAESFRAFRRCYGGIFLLVASASIACGVLLGAVHRVLAIRVFGDSSLQEALRVVAWFLPAFALLRLNVSALMARKRVAAAVALDHLLHPLLMLAGLLAWAVGSQPGGTGPIHLHAAVVIGCLLPSFGVLAGAPRWGHRPTEVEGKRFAPAPFVRIAVTMSVTVSLQLLLTQADLVMLGMIESNVMLGIYRICAKLAALAAFPLLAAAGIGGALIAGHRAAGRRAAMVEVARTASLLVAALSAFPVVIMLLYGRPLLAIFGSEFAQGVPVLWILTAGQAVNTGCGLVGVFLNIDNGEREFRDVVLVAAVVNILLNALLIPRHGLMGAAVATAVSGTVWNVWAAWLVRRRVGAWIGPLPWPFRFDWCAAAKGGGRS